MTTAYSRKVPSHKGGFRPREYGNSRRGGSYFRPSVRGEHEGMELFGYTGDHFKVPAGRCGGTRRAFEGTGVSRENGEMQGPAPEDVVKAVGDASKLYASYGLTTVHDGKVRKGSTSS